jgi:hypothetical protein
VKTCEQCGADTVDAGGRCATCGWQAEPETVLDTPDAAEPVDAETRAADVPDALASAQPARGSAAARTNHASAPGFDRTVDLPRHGGPSQPASPPSPPRAARPTGSAAPPSTPGARYCGACGARIVGSEAFCGHCGTPLAQMTGAFGPMVGDAQAGGARYRVGAPGPWSGAQPDDLTEAYVPAAHGPYSRGGPSVPLGRGAYPANGYPAGGYPANMQPGAASGSRTGRVVAGVLCLAAGLASAAAAVIIALH